MADADIERIIAAGREAGRAQPTLRFSTKEEYEAWHEKQRLLLAEVFAPEEGGPYEQNPAGDKIASIFAEIHTFEIFKLINTRCIIGDYASYEEYMEHVAEELKETFAQLCEEN